MQKSHVLLNMKYSLLFTSLFCICNIVASNFAANIETINEQIFQEAYNSISDICSIQNTEYLLNKLENCEKMPDGRIDFDHFINDPTISKMSIMQIAQMCHILYLCDKYLKLRNNIAWGSYEYIPECVINNGIAIII